MQLGKGICRVADAAPAQFQIADLHSFPRRQPEHFQPVLRRSLGRGFIRGAGCGKQQKAMKAQILHSRLGGTDVA